MKKLFYLAAVALVAGMASCGGNKAEENAEPADTAVEAVVTEVVEEAPATEGEEAAAEGEEAPAEEAPAEEAAAE